MMLFTHGRRSLVKSPRVALLAALPLLALSACSAGETSTGDSSGNSGGNAGSAGSAGSGGSGNAPPSGGAAGTGGGSSGSGGSVAGSGGVSGSGNAGSGGVTETGGAAGTGGGGTAGTGGGSGAGVACTGSELLCEDFEDATDDGFPGTPWIARATECTTTTNFAMVASGEQVHTGTRALKVTNASWAQCRIAAPFAQSDDFWVRAFMYWDAAVNFSGREMLAIDLLPPSGVGRDDPAIRFGDRQKEPCTATPGPQITLIGIAGGEQTGCSGTVPTPKGAWHCFEAHVTQTDVVSVRTYLNGNGLTYEASGKPVSETIATPSAPAEKINHLRLGIFSNDQSSQGVVYIDDVAVSNTRLGCGT